MRFHSIGWAILFLSLSAIAGCGGSKDFTPAQFQTVTPGMTEAQVIEILGAPKETLETKSVRRLFWENKGKFYSISFTEGKVVSPLEHANKDDYDMMKALMAVAKDMPGGSSTTQVGKSGTSSPEPSLTSLPVLQSKAQFKLEGKFKSLDRIMQLSADGSILAVQCRNPDQKSVIKVWTVAGDSKELGVFEGQHFALSPSGKFLLTSSIYSKPTVFEVGTKKPVAKLSLSFSDIFFRDDNTLVCTQSSSDFSKPSKGKIVVWDVARNADAGSFEVPDNRFSTALPVNGGKEIWLFMSNDKFEVECYDLDAKKLLRLIKPENAGNGPLASGVYQSVAPDGSTFASNTPHLNVYDGTSGQIVGGLPAGVGGSPIGHLPGGSRFLGHPIKWDVKDLSENDYVICDWKARKGLALIRAPHGGEHSSQTAASGDGKILVVLTDNGEGSVYDISSIR